MRDFRKILNVLRLYIGLQKVRNILLVDVDQALEHHMRRAYPHASYQVMQHFEPLSVRERYDVIISKAALSWENISDHLSHDGYVIANSAEGGTSLYELNRWLSSGETWAIYQNKSVGAALQNGYRPLREWPDFDPTFGMSALSPQYVGRDRGLYWRLWPVSFEKFHSHKEPRIEPLPRALRMPFRVIMWQRLREGETPAGWKRFSDEPAYKFGFLDISEEGFEKRWSESAKREIKKWKEYSTSEYRVVEISYDAFAAAYKKSTIPFSLKDSVLWEVRMRMKNPGTTVTFLGMRREKDHTIVAGVARMHSNALPIDYYVAGFYVRAVKKLPVVTSLFYHWANEARKGGKRFLDLGNFWRSGADLSWKGFSRFKAKFNPTYFFYPPVLYKFEWNGF